MGRAAGKRAQQEGRASPMVNRPGFPGGSNLWCQQPFGLTGMRAGSPKRATFAAEAARQKRL